MKVLFLKGEPLYWQLVDFSFKIVFKICLMTIIQVCVIKLHTIVYLSDRGGIFYAIIIVL